MIHFWLGAFLLLSTLFRATRLVAAIRRAKRSAKGKVASKPIFWVMTLSYLIYLSLCVREGWTRNDLFAIPVFLFGVALYGLALSLREVAMRDLGRFFSPNIEIREAHHVIREGLYRYIRHPLLLCMMLEITAVGLVFNAYHSLLWGGFWFYFPLIGVRWLLEEKELVNSLGDEYRRYQEEVGPFIPKVSILFQTHER